MNRKPETVMILMRWQSRKTAWLWDMFRAPYPVFGPYSCGEVARLCVRLLERDNTPVICHSEVWNCLELTFSGPDNAIKKVKQRLINKGKSVNETEGTECTEESTDEAFIRDPCHVAFQWLIAVQGKWLETICTVCRDFHYMNSVLFQCVQKSLWHFTFEMVKYDQYSMGCAEIPIRANFLNIRNENMVEIYIHHCFFIGPMVRGECHMPIGRKLHLWQASRCLPCINNLHRQKISTEHTYKKAKLISASCLRFEPFTSIVQFETGTYVFHSSLIPVD